MAGYDTVNAVGALKGANDMIFLSSDAAYFVGKLNSTDAATNTMAVTSVSP